jgi:glycosyltransferase involved in cell wall biosynthesis
LAEKRKRRPRFCIGMTRRRLARSARLFLSHLTFAIVQKEIRPKVSVCVITYNQAPYIRECLQSIVDQETDFPFEVIVGADCSSDDGRGILLGFAARYPGMVKTLFRTQHIGGAQNLLGVYAQAQGEFIAYIDGDDAMLPGKPRTQAAALPNDPARLHELGRQAQRRALERFSCEATVDHLEAAYARALAERARTDR